LGSSKVVIINCYGMIVPTDSEH